MIAATAAAVLAACRTVPHAESVGAAAVRAARATYSAAWNARDTAAMHHAWMGNFRLHQQHGAEFEAGELLQQAADDQQRADPAREVRIYVPAEVRIYTPRRLAFESGEYRIVMPARGAVGAAEERGRYAAQWSLGPGGWRLVAELLSPTECTGEGGRCGGR